MKRYDPELVDCCSECSPSVQMVIAHNGDYYSVEEVDAEIAKLKAEREELESRVAKLLKRVDELNEALVLSENV